MAKNHPLSAVEPLRRALLAFLAGLVAIFTLYANNVSAQTLDATFTPSFNETVRALAVQSDGSIIAGGQFTIVNGQNRYALARLGADGSLAAAFPAGPNKPVLVLAVQADGRIIVGGSFETMGGVAHGYIARLLADGSLDSSFVSQIATGAANEVTHVGVQSDGKIVIGGRFSSISGQPRDRLARLNANGSLDTGFAPPDINSAISAMALAGNGQVLFHGSSSAVTTGCSVACVIRLLADGSVDTSFVITQIAGPAEHLSVQSNGRILISGAFGSIGTHPTNFVGRLLANGAVDTSFANTELRSSNIERIVQQADDRILIAGQVRWGSPGVADTKLVRLSSSGARDTSFSEPIFNSLLNELTLQPDQGILIGGMYTSAGGIARNRLARFVGPRPDPVYSNGFD